MPTLTPQTTGSTTTQTDWDYIIPDSVIENYPDLVELIKQTEAMNLEEKNYWFKIMPLMNEEQIANLRWILVKEREKLDEINRKYNQDIQEINDKHQAEITALEAQKRREELRRKEQEDEAEESEEEAALLEELENL